MNTDNIKHINKAIEVLKHFVELSATLLPYFKSLKSKQDMNEIEVSEISKIHDVFETYEVDDKTSVLLLNSDIIGLIKSSYKAIKNQKNEDDIAVKYYLSRFEKEYQRLKDDWTDIELN